MSPLRASVFALLACATGLIKAEYEPAGGTSAPDVQFATFGATSGDVQWSGADTTDDCSGIAPTCCECPLWTLQAGAVILARTSRSAVLLQNTVTGDALLNTSDLATPWAAGPDISLRRWLADGDSVDIRFFAVDGWNSRANLSTSPIWNFPTNPPLFGLGVADVSVFYATRLYSTEINWNRPANDWLTWLVGFRWIELYENLGYNANFGGNAAQVNFQTANRLYGGQLGATAAILNQGAWRVDGIFKGGLYGNAATGGMVVTQSIGPSFLASDKSGQVAFVGDIGVVAVYQWTENLALRGGYQLLWLDGVALAPDQVAATQIITASGIDSKGDAFYHGALLGVQVAW
jgi:hypothetical protein